MVDDPPDDTPADVVSEEFTSLRYQWEPHSAQEGIVVDSIAFDRVNGIINISYVERNKIGERSSVIAQITVDAEMVSNQIDVILDAAQDAVDTGLKSIRLDRQGIAYEHP